MTENPEMNKEKKIQKNETFQLVLSPPADQDRKSSPVGSCKKAVFACLATDIKQDTFT